MLPVAVSLPAIFSVLPLWDKIELVMVAFPPAAENTSPPALSVYVHTTGDRDTKDSYLEALRSRYVYYLHLHREREAIVIQGVAAVATGRQIGLSVLDGNPGLIDSLYLAVWVRGDPGWQLFAWHATKFSLTARV